MAYYFCCSAILAPGSVVEPGNWGRILRLYTQQRSPNAWLLARELIYEGIRRASYSSKPSRFGAAFVCFTEADLQQFRLERAFDVSYEVELVDPGANRHVADWNVAAVTQTDDVAAIEGKAHLYWQGQNPVKKELVTDSPLRILKRL
jgi:hypothetical protein